MTGPPISLMTAGGRSHKPTPNGCLVPSTTNGAPGHRAIFTPPYGLARRDELAGAGRELARLSGADGRRAYQFVGDYLDAFTKHTVADRRQLATQNSGRVNGREWKMIIRGRLGNGGFKKDGPRAL